MRTIGLFILVCVTPITMVGQSVHFLGAHNYRVMEDSSSTAGIRLTFVRTDSEHFTPDAFVEVGYNPNMPYFDWADQFSLVPCENGGAYYLKNIDRIARDSEINIVVRFTNPDLGGHWADTVCETILLGATDSNGTTTIRDVDTFFVIRQQHTQGKEALKVPETQEFGLTGIGKDTSVDLVVRNTSSFPAFIDSAYVLSGRHSYFSSLSTVDTVPARSSRSYHINYLGSGIPGTNLDYFIIHFHVSPGVAQSVVSTLLAIPESGIRLQDSLHFGDITGLANVYSSVRVTNLVSDTLELLPNLQGTLNPQETGPLADWTLLPDSGRTSARLLPSGERTVGMVLFLYPDNPIFSAYNSVIFQDAGPETRPFNGSSYEFDGSVLPGGDSSHYPLTSNETIGIPVHASQTDSQQAYMRFSSFYLMNESADTIHIRRAELWRKNCFVARTSPSFNLPYPLPPNASILVSLEFTGGTPDDIYQNIKSYSDEFLVVTGGAYNPGTRYRTSASVQSVPRATVHIAPNTPSTSEVWPNPSTGSFTIDCTQTHVLKVSIFDEVGRELPASSVLASENCNYVLRVPAGAYQVRIQETDGEGKVTTMVKSLSIIH